ncbi:MAG: L-serine ammonia-lyase, iron-sulfur-dependent subunit beta [Eubacteriales bacterium]|nr:L-serine ammonia-lyase, iron-sulfur-dependent subunit beta [Eubacteriales bacterium]MDD4323952.1 L-serine ammonia-lyase, iron-sulfur-dependent subunit beta [Eubacteriales bacterium]MDD4540898.1 L-serine ammonia-lyase, iron-sulfur-dependent subunit beta [Eubacteriales bacterium]
MSVYKSLFDIIGPVMVGPSSSHTAGAVRIGLVARSIFGMTPEEVRIVLFGSFAHTYQGHGTDLALISGLLGLPTSSEKIRQAYDMAEEANMKVTIETSDEPTEHANTVDLYLKSSGGHSLSLRGVSLGGGTIDITRIDGFDIHLSGENPAILVFYKDQPGIITQVTGVLSKADINISNMEVSRTAKGERALMLLATDGEIPPQAMEDIGRISQIYQVIALGALNVEPDLIVDSETKEEYSYGPQITRDN